MLGGRTKLAWREGAERGAGGGMRPMKNDAAGRAAFGERAREPQCREELFEEVSEGGGMRERVWRRSGSPKRGRGVRVCDA